MHFLGRLNMRHPQVAHCLAKHQFGEFSGVEASPTVLLREEAASPPIALSGRLDVCDARSFIYAYDHNLMMAVPYFNYYTVLNACRAYLMTAPQLVWDGQKTVEMTHEKILNCAADYMRNLDPERRLSWRAQMGEYRDQRTLFSYRFPLSGPDFIGREALDPKDAIALAQMVAELGALNSECFDAVLKKHVDENIAVTDLDDHDWARLYKLAGEDEIDHADRYRFGKLRQRWRRVSPLHVLVSDGMMDDLFGSWTNPDREDNDGGFDPDECSNLILRF
jgi:hypothetical protein